MNILKNHTKTPFASLAYLCLCLSLVLAVYTTFNLSSALAAETMKIETCAIAEGESSCLTPATTANDSAGVTNPILYNATRNFTISDKKYVNALPIRLGYGGNVIQLRDGKKVLKEMILNVSCAGVNEVKLLWDEQQNKCVRNAQLVGEKGCFIGLNKDSCVGSLHYESENYKSVTVYNLTTKKTLDRGVENKKVQVDLTYGKNIIELRAGGAVISQFEMVSWCGTDLVWNGSKCGPSGFDIISDVQIYGKGYNTEDNSCTSWTMVACDTRDNMPPVKLDFYMDGKLFDTAKPNYSTGGFRNTGYINTEKYQYMPGCGLNDGNLYGYKFALPAEFKDNKARTLTIKATRWNTNTNSYRGGDTRAVAYNGWEGYRGYPQSFPIKCAPTAPPKCELNVSDANLALGDKTKLTWKVTQAEGQAFITNNKNSEKLTVTANNKVANSEVQPKVTTKYTMTVKSLDGREATCSRVVAVADTAAADLTASNCEIAVGASTCNSNVSWNIKGATAPNVWNLSRQVSVGVGAVKNVQHKLTFGTNRLIARNNMNVLKTQLPEATCEATAEWDGNKCVKIAVLSAADCTIAPNKSICQSKMSWLIPGYVSNPSVYNKTTKTTYSSVAKFKGNQEIKRGVNTIQLLDGKTVVKAVTATANCPVSAPWDGSVCKPITNPALCPPTAPWNGTVCADANTVGIPLSIELTAKSKLVRMNEKTDISWVLSADPVGYTCTLSGPGITSRLVTTITGTTVSGPVTSESVYKLTCVGADTAEGSVTVEVVPNVQEV